MKKSLWMLLLAVLLVMALVATGCGTDDNDEDPDQDENGEVVDDDVDLDEVFFVGLVTDTGGIDDASFNQGTWEGVLEFVNSIDNGDANYLQSEADADYIPNLSSFADEQVDLIVAPGFLFEEAMGTVADNFPNQNFLIIDTVVERDNVASAVFAEHEGSFLVGVAAALKAQEAGEDTVGFLGGMDFPLIQRFEAGFEAGVLTVDPNMNILVQYAGDFNDVPAGRALSSQMYDDGAYVIFHAAGGTGNGLFAEARERRSDGEDVWAIGVDLDQYEEGIYDGDSSAVLTSMLKRVDVAAHDVSEMTYNGNFPGGEVIVFNLENEGVGIPADNPNMSDEMVEEVLSYIDDIVSGAIEVPEVPSRVE